MMPMGIPLSESYSPLRMTGWALIQVDAVSCDATCDCMCIKVLLADLIVSRISEDELRSWAIEEHLSLQGKATTQFQLNFSYITISCSSLINISMKTL